jgi:hypothetical protein
VYPLLLALMGGAVWVDRVYSRSLDDAVPAGVLATAGVQVADGLLLLSLAVLVSGAVAVRLLSGIARHLCLASIAVFSLEFLVPVLVRSLPGGGYYIDVVGPFLRVAILAMALGLAVMATRRAVA